MKGSSNGFYNIEYPLPETLLTDAQGAVKHQFVVRLTASAQTLCPGLYGLRLVSGHTGMAYQFRAAEWTTGDTWRLPAGQIAYNGEQNTLTVNQGGANNVCLMLDYTKRDYTILPEQVWLVVRGQALSLADGASYLWWFNGTNRGSSVVPPVAREVVRDGTSSQVIAWNLPQSGLGATLSATAPTNVTQGQTIFGRTSTTGTSLIQDIQFLSPEGFQNYLALADGMDSPTLAATSSTTAYTPDGLPASAQYKGVRVNKGKKALYP